MSDHFDIVKNHEELVSSFAVVSKSKKFIFSTPGFEEISGKNAGLKEYTTNKVILDDSKVEFDFNDLLILKKEFSLNPNSETLFFIFVRDKKYDNRTILRHCHDIQAPLRNIANFLQLIKTHLANIEDNEVEKYINFAIDNSKELGEFTERYLYEHKEISHSRINIKNLIDSISKFLRTQIEKRKCKINIDDDIPDIMGKHSSIFSLFKNLIENSLEHAVSNELVIRILLISRSDFQVVIEFEDNGEDFSLKQKNKIKKALRECSSDDNFGVSICKEIVKQHGGNMSLSDNSFCSYKIVLPIYNGG